MDAGAAFQFRSVVGFSMSLSFSKQRYLGNSCISMREVAVHVPPSPFAIQNADGGVQTSRRNEDERSKTFNSNQPKSQDHEEIIALIKRIRVSISKGHSKRTGKTSSDVKNDKPEPKKQVKAANVSNRTKEKHLPERIAQYMKKQEEAQEHHHVPGFKLSRAPSKFVKKSPIPFLSPPRGIAIGQIHGDVSLTTMVGKKVQSERIEGLRLAELKQLAKSRGVKGYSKLKKGELIKILGC